MFSEAARNLAPWSVSKAKLIRTCPLAFHYKYVEKRKEAPSPITRVGVAAHSVLERVERGEPFEQALPAVRGELDLSAEELASLAALVGAIRAFMATIAAFRARTNIRKELREERLGLDPNLTPTGFFAPDVFFRGAWDLGFVLEDDRVAIIDHKASRRKDLKWHADQLKSYSVMALAHFPELRKVCSAIHFIGDGVVVWSTPHSAEEIRGVLRRWFVAWINDAAERASRPDPQPVVSKFCTFCGHRPICPAHTIEAAGERLVQLSTNRARHF